MALLSKNSFTHTQKCPGEADRLIVQLSPVHSGAPHVRHFAICTKYLPELTVSLTSQLSGENSTRKTKKISKSGFAVACNTLILPFLQFSHMGILQEKQNPGFVVQNIQLQISVILPYYNTLHGKSIANIYRQFVIVKMFFLNALHMLTHLQNTSSFLPHLFTKEDT